ncbi:MAG: radical SAM protein [Patescibacteria group bacterium]
MLKNKLYLAKKIANRFAEGNRNFINHSLGQTLKPKWIWYEVTDKCNSHCTHCHIWEKKTPSRTLTLEELRKAFSDPLFSEVETVINSGGEAILRGDIIDLIRLEHEIFPKASLDLSTNGILAERVVKIVETVLEEKIKINVGVSLDALGAKHDEIRGVPGNFNKVDYLLNELVRLRKKYPHYLSIVAGLTLSPLTLEGWEDVKKYLDEKDIELMVQWYNQSSFYENDNMEKEANLKKMFKAVEAQPNTIIREKWLKLLGEKPIKFKCFAAETFFAMKCDGSIVPCLSYWDSILGNVRNESPAKIWNGEKAKEARKAIANCPGCLNSWGVEWSASTIFYPRLFFYLRHPKAVLDRLKRRD